jgi:hypothetical protein
MKRAVLLIAVFLLGIHAPSWSQKSKLPEINRKIMNDAYRALNTKVGKDWKFVGGLLQEAGAQLGKKAEWENIQSGDIFITNGFKQFIVTEKRDYWITLPPALGIVYKSLGEKKFRIITVTPKKIAVASEWDLSKINLDGGKYFVHFIRPVRGNIDPKSLKTQ